MSAETKGLDMRAPSDSEQAARSAVPGAGHEEPPKSDEHGPAWDYFTDSVPLRGDRDLREREERIGRLEQARPRSRPRRPRLWAGVVGVAVVALTAVGLSVLGRSSPRNSGEPRSTPQRTPYAPPAIAAAPRIGLAPAVRVAREKPRRLGSHARPHPRHGRSESTDPDADEVPVTPAVTAPEAAEPEVAVEPEAAVAPAPEAPTSVAPEPEGEPKTSSSSEENRQFGFGR
jgi:hypothetical protein